MVATCARHPADEVYNHIKALDPSYDDYKHTAATSADWRIDLSGRPPYDAPAHEGAIRYRKEKGLWRAEDQAWRDDRLAQRNAARAAFDDMRVVKRAKGEKIGDEQWPAFWETRRLEALNT